MSRGRYTGTTVIDGRHLGTWRPLRRVGPAEIDILDGVRHFRHTFSAGERLDTLAARFFGDDGYMWVIALANGIAMPLDISPGTKLRIPYDVRDILRKVLP